MHTNPVKREYEALVERNEYLLEEAMKRYNENAKKAKPKKFKFTYIIK